VTARKTGAEVEVPRGSSIDRMYDGTVR
jgi:hypothetical protein